MASSRPTVLVTEPEYRKVEELFTSAADLECLRAPDAEPELASAVRDARATHVVVGLRTYAGPLYDALAPGGVIARFGVGHDGLDKGLATAHGLLCTNTPGALDDSVAEHAMGLVLALARHTPFLSGRLIAGDWSSRLGVELSG